MNLFRAYRLMKLNKVKARLGNRRNLFEVNEQGRLIEVNSSGGLLCEHGYVPLEWAISEAWEIVEE